MTSLTFSPPMSNSVDLSHSRSASGPTPRSLQQRWFIHDPDPTLVAAIAQETGLNPLLAKVLVNQGLTTPAEAQVFLNPEQQALPSPLVDFPDLGLSLELLETAIKQQDAIAICGDYDADGMTSTALLLRAFRDLGAKIDYAIPSRMAEGYGINERIVEEFAEAGVKLILTVDNGIAAYNPIARARELDVAVIITDHHDVPPQLPPANAILNPKLIDEASPYRGLAGVGVAYVLAASLAQRLGKGNRITPLLELFTLGTIADLAPLTGVNRRWVKRGLKRLPHSQYAGVQSLIQVSGGGSGSGSGDGSKDALKPDAIGFRLGPRINAVGRIADPQTVIELLTTDDWDIALNRAADCERINRERQLLCTQIEQEAIARVEGSKQGPEDPHPQRDRILVLVQAHWHHGVIGIVASRLVERYGVPVFIATYEDETQTEIRGSARGTPEFDVFAALQFCDQQLERYGGHRAAGGFTLTAKNLPQMRSRLIDFAQSCLTVDQLKPLITIDAEAQLKEMTWELFEQIDRLHPCGIGNPEPVFWSPSVTVLEQRVIGKQRNHLKLTVSEFSSATGSAESAEPITFKAMAWRWGEYAPLPDCIDIAYRLRDNYWNGESSLELELLGYRPRDPEITRNTTQHATQDNVQNKTQDTTQKIIQPRGREMPSVLEMPSVSEMSRTPYPKTPDPETPQIDIPWRCPEPPLSDPPQAPKEWLPLDQPLESWISSLSGTVLLYGDQRPELSAELFSGTLEYDRPTQPCDVLLLWTLPPSWQHLKWLLALGKPSIVYVRSVVPQFLEEKELRSHLKQYQVDPPNQPLNLLALGQQWWLAPSTIVSALREVGYACTGFPQTLGLSQEYQRLVTWYQYPAHLIGNIG